MKVLIADSGATKCEWRFVGARANKSYFTQGMSPYFLSRLELEEILRKELLSQLGRQAPDSISFYGTGCKSPQNSATVKAALAAVFPKAIVSVTHDLYGAAKSLCQHEKGIACILGTGSNSCFYSGKKISRNIPGIGYVLGDEGSGAYLGKKVLQHVLYGLFEKDLLDSFSEKYRITAADILIQIYQKPLPNRFIASFAGFLSDHRGHYMIENIIEDGLNDFFLLHVNRYRESAKYPVHFTGGIAWHFQDTIRNLCDQYGFTAGTFLKTPMEGLVKYHKSIL